MPLPPRRVIRKHYNVDWLVPADFNNKHKGKRGFVIGGGHSMKTIRDEGFDFNVINKDDVSVGANKAYRIMTPTYLIFGDFYFWKHFEREIMEVDCIKIAPENILKGKRPDRFIIIQRSMDVNQTIPAGLDKPFSFVNNTGVAALRAAFVLGCNPIYLLGIDIGPDTSGQTHFHNEYTDPSRVTPFARYQQFSTVFKKTIEAMQERGRRIYSCSPTSSLNEVVEYVPISSLTF